MRFALLCALAISWQAVAPTQAQVHTANTAPIFFFRSHLNRRRVSSARRMPLSLCRAWPATFQNWPKTELQQTRPNKPKNPKADFSVPLCRLDRAS